MFSQDKLGLWSHFSPRLQKQDSFTNSSSEWVFSLLSFSFLTRGTRLCSSVSVRMCVSICSDARDGSFSSLLHRDTGLDITAIYGSWFADSHAARGDHPEGHIIRFLTMPRWFIFRIMNKLLDGSLRDLMWYGSQENQWHFGVDPDQWADPGFLFPLSFNAASVFFNIFIDLSENDSWMKKMWNIEGTDIYEWKQFSADPNPNHIAILVILFISLQKNNCCLDFFSIPGAGGSPAVLYRLMLEMFHAMWL